MQPVADVVQVMRPRSGYGQAIPVRAKTMQQGKDNEEQEGKPDTVRGQGLCENGGQDIHKMNLLHEAPRFLYLVAIIAHTVPRSQGDVGQNSVE